MAERYHLTEETAEVAVGDLVEDLGLYPRIHGTSDANVRKLTDVIEGGLEADLPLIIAEKGTLRIADGFHRRKAFLKVRGEDYRIRVRLRTYPSDAELFMDAAAINDRQGMALSQQDRTGVALKLTRLGVETQTIAVALHVEEAKVEKIKARVAIVDNGGTLEIIPAKPIIRARPGEQVRALTPGQAAVHFSSGGRNAAQVITQLTAELESGLIEITPAIKRRLARLQDVIASVL